MAGTLSVRTSGIFHAHPFRNNPARRGGLFLVAVCLRSVLCLGRHLCGRDAELRGALGTSGSGRTAVYRSDVSASQDGTTLAGEKSSTTHLPLPVADPRKSI